MGDTTAIGRAFCKDSSDAVAAFSFSASASATSTIAMQAPARSPQKTARTSACTFGGFAKSHRFPFPYLHDEGQAAARAYGAVCTPDFFGYDAGRKLKYRGRLDEGRTNAPPA